MARLTTASAKFKILVANLDGSGDPSRGRNPTKIRTGFSQQILSEVPREAVESRVQDPSMPGLHSSFGVVTAATPGVIVPAAGTILVTSANFAYPATVYLGQYTVTSDEDYDVSTGDVYTGEDITNTVPDGIIVIWKTAGAGVGEGTIDVPAHVPIEPGTVTISWTSGAAAKSQTVDGAGVFSGDGNPAGSTINHATGAITLDTTGDIPDAATTITIDYTTTVTTTIVATRLAAAIASLPQFSASSVGATITVEGPPGALGNDTHFEAVYFGTVENFTLTPSADFMSGAEPYIGPPDILS